MAHKFVARRRGSDASQAIVLEEDSFELAALAFVEAAGLVVDIPGVVTIDVRDMDLGLDLSFEIDLAPADRRRAA